MNAHNLNQSGRQISDEPYQSGSQVYFYLPPTQQEVLKTGRKVKHLMHYRGPATVTKLIPGRRRQYEIEFQGKTFKRDVGMLVPEQTISEIDVTTQPNHYKKQINHGYTQKEKHSMKKN